MSVAECEGDVCAYERYFHEAIREYLLVTILFGLLYFCCALVVRRFRRPPAVESLEADASDHSVIRISLWLCTFSLAVSCAAVLLLPVSVLVNEIISREAFRDNYYLRWLNVGLIRMLWKMVSFFTNLCLFVLLPFAYFFSEAEGLSIRSLSFFPLLNPSSLLRRDSPGLRPRICEALLLVCILAVFVCGLIWVASHYPMLALLFSAPLDARPAPTPPPAQSFYSLATKLLLFRIDDPLLASSPLTEVDDSWKTLFDFWNFHLPRLYSFVSAFGAIAALYCMPTGFVKIFIFLKDVLNKPGPNHNRPPRQSEGPAAGDPAEALEAVRLSQHALERKLHSCLTCAARSPRFVGLDAQVLADDPASLMLCQRPVASVSSHSIAQSLGNGVRNGSPTPTQTSSFQYSSSNNIFSQAPARSTLVNGGTALSSPLTNRTNHEHCAQAQAQVRSQAPDSPAAPLSANGVQSHSSNSCSSLLARLFARPRSTSQSESDCASIRAAARAAAQSASASRKSSSGPGPSGSGSTLSRMRGFANGFSLPLSSSLNFRFLKQTDSQSQPERVVHRALFSYSSSKPSSKAFQTRSNPNADSVSIVPHRKCTSRTSTATNSVAAQCAQCKSVVKELETVKEKLADLERQLAQREQRAPSRFTSVLRFVFHMGLQLVALSFTALICVLIVLQLGSLKLGYRTVVSAEQQQSQGKGQGMSLELDLGPGSFVRSSFGLLGALVEVALLVYLLVAHLAGFYGSRVGARLLPRAHATSLTQMLAHSWVLLVLTAVLPIQARMLGLTHFSLLGHFAHVRWLRDLRLVLLYDACFALFTGLARAPCFPTRFIIQFLRNGLALIIHFICIFGTCTDTGRFTSIVQY